MLLSQFYQNGILGHADGVLAYAYTYAGALALNRDDQALTRLSHKYDLDQGQINEAVLLGSQIHNQCCQ